MFIKYFDEQGYLSIRYYLSQMTIHIKQSSDNPEQFNVMMSDVVLVSGVDFEKSKEIVNGMFDTLREGENFFELTEYLD